MPRFTTALIQLNSQDDVAANVMAIEASIREAASKGADFVCLPENTFYMKEPGKAGYPDVQPQIDACGALATEFNLWLLIGSAPMPAPSGKSYNRSLLINSYGAIQAEYNKIHLFDVTLKNGEIYQESSRVESGDKAVIARTPWGKVGMTVCYDLRFPHLFRALAKGGADFITVPSAFTYTTGTAHWHALLRARAIENGCYIIAPAQCGIHPGNRRTYGHSLVVSPWGEIVAEAGEDSPCVVLADIDTDKTLEARSMIPSLSHDRNFSTVVL